MKVLISNTTIMFISLLPLLVCLKEMFSPLDNLLLTSLPLVIFYILYHYPLTVFSPLCIIVFSPFI
jgi:hypothetical protein